MAYRYPEDIFVSWDLMDDRIPRLSLQSGVEELSGYLNEHNIVAGTFPRARLAAAAAFDFHTAEVAADTEVLPTNALPQSTNGWRIPEGGEWVTVDQMEVSWEGSNDKIWAIGWVQYAIVPSGGVLQFSVNQTSYTKPRVQFALRVNGVVQEESITGTLDPVEVTPVLFQAVAPITPAANDFVTLDQMYIYGANSMCWHCRPVRFQLAMPVPQGTVTVDIVVRRISPADPIDITGETESVYVFNRKLFVLQSKQGATGSVGGPTSPNVTWPDAFSTIWGSASLEGDILTPISDSINALGDGNIMRHGLRREHLPNTLRSADQEALTSGSTTTRTYPGWNSGGTVGVGNWSEVTDGSGNLLRVTGPFDYSARPAFVLLLANVALTKASGGAISADRYGHFAIAGQYSSGTDFLDSGNEGLTNNPNITSSTDLFDCDTDVPLLQWYDYRTTPPAGGEVAAYRVLVTLNGFTAGTVEYDRSSFQVIHFYP